MTNGFGNHVIACIGGDEREREIVRLAAASGATVRAHGIPDPDNPIPGVTFVSSPAEAASGATVLILPLPGMQGLTIFAPRHDATISIDEEVLNRLAPGAPVFCGHASPEFASLAARLKLTVHEYEPDTAGRLARVPAIVEGTIARIVANTDRTIHAARIAIVGYGIVGAHVAAGLRALGADTYVFARNREQRAAAFACGHHAGGLDELAAALPEMDMVVSSPPVRVLSEALLARLRPDCVVFDLSSPPCSVDHDAARRLGTKLVWARGLGSTSPVTVGRAQWSVMEAILRG